MTGDRVDSRPPSDLPSWAGAAWEEPWDAIESFRRAGDVVWSAELDAWVVTAYAACRQVAREDGKRWQKVYRPEVTADELVELWGGGSPRGIIYVPPHAERNSAEHGRVHGWWIRTLSTGGVERWRDTVIQPVINEQIDRFISAGRAELYRDLAGRFPVRVIAGILGLPADDEFVEEWVRLFRRATAVRDVRGEADGGETKESSAQASRALRDMLLPFVRSRRSGSGDDFISQFWRAAPEIFDEGWGELDVVANMRLMFQAGSRTTAHAAANTLYVLLTGDAELRDGLIRHAERIPALVEEVLRMYSPVEVTLRRATGDVELGGRIVRRGDIVMLVNSAAGRDERHYEGSADVDLNRRSRRDHLAFHAGARACVGQFLARVELEEMVLAMLSRAPDIRLDPRAEPPRYLRDGALYRRWEPLHAVFTPGEPLAVGRAA